MPLNSQRFRFLFADDKSIYGILPTGELLWFPQWNDPTLAPRATAGRQIGSGWGDFIHVFAGGGGIIYAISSDGTLRWYNDSHRDGTDGWFAGSGNAIGSGWQDFTHVFSGGSGLIYAISPQRALLFYRDLKQDGSNAPDGSTGWASGSGSQIGREWVGFRHIVSGGNGAIYAVRSNGDLCWYRDDLQDGTNAADGSTGWNAKSGSVIGTGWDYFTHVFSGGPGQLFGVQMLQYGGYIRQYIDLNQDGTSRWNEIADADVQCSDPYFSAGWQIASAESYCWPIGIGAGESAQFHVSVMTPGACAAEIVRLTGRGPQLGTAVPSSQPYLFLSNFQPDHGWASDCSWPVSFEVSAPQATQAWTPGFYAARVMGPAGPPYDVPFVVKRGATPGNIALLVNVNTWNAYNTWGGASNYTGTSTAVNLTLKRPNHHLLTGPQDHISGNHMLRSEIWLLDWLQSQGYAVDLLTDVDLDSGADLSPYKALVLNTHPEYWTQAMMLNVKKYLDAAGNVLYLGGNGMYRPTSLSSEHGDGNSDLMATQSTQWSPADYPTYEGKPLLAAHVDQLGGPPQQTGVTVNAGQPFVPADPPTTPVGTSGWNTSAYRLAPPWGASGWETDYWPAPFPAGVSELARDSSRADGAVIASFRTQAGGFVLGVGSITFVGSLMEDTTLQSIIINALSDALG